MCNYSFNADNNKLLSVAELKKKFNKKYVIQPIKKNINNNKNKEEEDIYINNLVGKINYYGYELPIYKNLDVNNINNVYNLFGWVDNINNVDYFYKKLDVPILHTKIENDFLKLVSV